MVGDTDSRDILQSEEPLTMEYTPDEPIGREAEINRMSHALRPLSHGRSPTNLLVYGPAGIGKSICVTHVLERLETENRVKSVYINCWQYNTRPSFLTQLLISLGYPAPRKGKPVDELLSKLREWLDKNRNVAVALDEFDQLREQAQVIYDLQHVKQQTEQEIGLLLVSNQHPTSIELDPRSESRLNCQTLGFRPYSSEELMAILEERVEQAFRQGAVDDNVIETVAEEVAGRSGDCREALNRLLQAGRKADQRNEGKVTLDILEQV